MADEFLHVDYPNFDARGKYCSRCMHHNKSTWALLSRSTSTMRTQTFRSCYRLGEGGSSWRTLSNTLLIWSSLMSRSLNLWHEKNSSDFCLTWLGAYPKFVIFRMPPHYKYISSAVKNWIWNSDKYWNLPQETAKRRSEDKERKVAEERRKQVKRHCVRNKWLWLREPAKYYLADFFPYPLSKK